MSIFIFFVLQIGWILLHEILNQMFPTSQRIRILKNTFLKKVQLVTVFRVTQTQ